MIWHFLKAIDLLAHHSSIFNLCLLDIQNNGCLKQLHQSSLNPLKMLDGSLSFLIYYFCTIVSCFFTILKPLPEYLRSHLAYAFQKFRNSWSTFSPLTSPLVIRAHPSLLVFIFVPTFIPLSKPLLLPPSTDFLMMLHQRLWEHISTILTWNQPMLAISHMPFDFINKNIFLTKDTFLHSHLTWVLILLMG